MPPKEPPLYPLRFKEIYKKKIWGGPELKTAMAKKGATRQTGESWELSHRDGDLSVVANGAYKGWSLEKLFEGFRTEILGTEQAMRLSNALDIYIFLLPITVNSLSGTIGSPGLMPSFLLTLNPF